MNPLNTLRTHYALSACLIFAMSTPANGASRSTINQRRPYLNKISELSLLSFPIQSNGSFPNTIAYRKQDRHLRATPENLSDDLSQTMSKKNNVERTILVSYRFPSRLSSTRPQPFAIGSEPYRLLRKIQEENNITYESFARARKDPGFAGSVDKDEETETEDYAANMITRNIVLSRLSETLQKSSIFDGGNTLHGLELSTRPFQSSYLTGLHMEVIKTVEIFDASKLREILLQDPFVDNVYFDEVFEGQQLPIKSESIPEWQGFSSRFNQGTSRTGYKSPTAKPEVRAIPLPIDDLVRTPDTSPTSLVPNDAEFLKQWAHSNRQNGIRTPLAWSLWTGKNTEFVVALIDSGVDYDHPDLYGQFWQNLGEEDCYDGVDNDGNGYIDDCMGWDWIEDDNLPQDENGHGTASAGIVAGVADNSIGIAGVCWGCRLMILRTLDKDIKGTISGFIKALDYAISHGVKVSNHSYGGRGSLYAALEKAVARADEKGMLMVAAAGNYASNNDYSRQPTFPASYKFENILSVAASDENGELASFSCYGQKSVDLAAPGVGIYTTGLHGGYTFMDGTSFSAPFVTGAAALLWSQDPKMTATQVKSILLSSAVEKKGLQGQTGHGLLNIGKAVSTAKQHRESAHRKALALSGGEQSRKRSENEEVEIS